MIHVQSTNYRVEPRTIFELVRFIANHTIGSTAWYFSLYKGGTTAQVQQPSLVIVCSVASPTSVYLLLLVQTSTTFLYFKLHFLTFEIKHYVFFLFIL